MELRAVTGELDRRLERSDSRNRCYDHGEPAACSAGSSASRRRRRSWVPKRSRLRLRGTGGLARYVLVAGTRQ